MRLTRTIRTPEGSIRINPDGTTKPVPPDPRDYESSFLETHWPAVDEARPISALVALQLGLWSMVAQLRPYSFDVEQFARGGQVETRQLRFHRVLLDWARQEDDLTPMPSVVIQRAGEGTYTQQGLESELDEDTLDRFRPGTVLRQMAVLTQPMQLVVWSATKDDRAAIRKAFEDAFLDEPDDPRAGRRIRVRPYYDRLARYWLRGQDYPDDSPESAQSNQWALLARFDTEIDVVKLVPAPSLLQPRTSVRVGDADEGC